VATQNRGTQLVVLGIGYAAVDEQSIHLTQVGAQVY
jgi:hypothetical protein